LCRRQANILKQFDTWSAGTVIDCNHYRGGHHEKLTPPDCHATTLVAASGNDRPRPKTPSSGQHPRRRFLGLAAGAAALPALSHLANAQAYPTRPITMVVPFPPGGATDVIARNVAGRMRAALGQPVIIENVTGAGGTIATGRVVRAAPDGYTLSIGQSDTHVVNGATYTLQYDVLNDFEPVALLSSTPRAAGPKAQGRRLVSYPTWNAA
jgi:Tripartite tricarboxylate transporter family receptor